MPEIAQRSVLVVDDEPGVRKMLISFLELNGFRCAEAGSGEEALAQARTGAFDLIIMDIRMPGVSGMDVLRQIKSERPDQPIVMVTGASEVEFAVEAFRLGAQDYLIKPFSLEEMLIKVHEAMSKGAVGLGAAIDGDSAAGAGEPAGPANGGALATMAGEVDRLYDQIGALKTRLASLLSPSQQAQLREGPRTAPNGHQN